MKTICTYIYTAADITVPEIVKNEICASLNSNKTNVYLVAEKSNYIDKRELYQNLKSALDNHSKMSLSNKFYKYFNFKYGVISFIWAETISEAKSKVIWISKNDYTQLHKFIK